jgi:glutamine synthetase
MTVHSQESIIKAVRDNGVHFISLQFTDIMGTVKTITVPASLLASGSMAPRSRALYASVRATCSCAPT